jgi:DNA-binding NarL/FixJ family response regulator
MDVCSKLIAKEMKPMSLKTVVIVEDESAVRETSREELEHRSFTVMSAGTISDARKLINELSHPIGVAVLDMRFEKDPDEPETTGAQIGLKLKERCSASPPEFLIRSAYAEVSYYKEALDLGAAAYLSKESTDLYDVIRHVRVLMLKHFLKIENPDVIEQLNRIAATTKSEIDSITAFCEQTLKPSLADCLGAPFLLLLTDKNGTQNLAASQDIPPGSLPIYGTLQAMTHGNADLTNPYCFDSKHITHLNTPSDRGIIQRLAGAVFVPLASAYDYRLSLGLLKPSPEERFPEEPNKLARVITQYVRSTICDNFIKILVQLDIKRKTTLGSTSQFCLFLGQDQSAIVDDGVQAGDLRAETMTHRRLRWMAEDLEETGMILMSVAESLDDKGLTPVRMRELIEETWSDLRKDWGLRGVNFHIEGDCSVLANEVDLSIIVARVLQWLAQRKVATEPPNEPAILVRCETDDRHTRVIFEDCSRRLPQRLRERLFEPFTLAVLSARSLAMLPEKKEDGDGGEWNSAKHRPGYLPLYLAKTLVEEKYRGWFEDKSDDMEGEAGHRLVMQFHKAYESASLAGIKG